MKIFSGFFKFLKSIVLSIWAVLCSFGVDTWLFGEKPNVSWVEKAFHLQLDGATVNEAWDTHGGFLGDGTTYINLSLSNSIEDQIISINAEYAGETKGGPWYDITAYPLAYASMKEQVIDYRGDLNELIDMGVENGYFCLINNFDNKDEYVFITEDKAFGWFYNWELAVYDMDDMKLHYYESDS